MHANSMHASLHGTGHQGSTRESVRTCGRLYSYARRELSSSTGLNLEREIKIDLQSRAHDLSPEASRGRVSQS